MKTIIATFTLLTLFLVSDAQNRYEPFAEKPGSCPPALPVQICTRSCYADSHCLGIGKCCPTNCGGAVCSRPVTMRQPVPTEKPGSCPAVPTGRWICSPTCRDDSDCRGNSKCCKNRCGALTCQKPDIEVIESVNIPVVPLPDNRYDFPGNLNSYPYYRVNNN